MYSVMIVDDLSIFRRQIKKLPVWGAESGFVIRAEAQDGYRALEALRKDPVDLLITDIRMPVMDGLGLLKAVREENLARRVVFLTDYDEFSLAKEAIAHGIFDYLLKPVEAEAIAGVLRRVKEDLDAERAKAQELEMLRRTLDETVAPYYPEKEVTDLLRILGTHREGYPVILRQLFRATGAALDGDLLKADRVFSKALTDIRNRLIEEKPWLGELLDPEALLNPSPGVSLDFEEVLASFDRLARRLERIDPWGNGHPLVQQIKAHVIGGVDEGISQDELTERVHLSKKHIAETFRRETGVTLGDYLTTVKMHRAARLLTDPTWKIYQIAERLGYSDEYFTKLFKRTFGRTPMQYRSEATVN